MLKKGFMVLINQREVSRIVNDLVSPEFFIFFLQTGPKLQDSTVESKKGDHHVTYLFLQELHLLNILYLLRMHFQDDLQAVDLILQKLLMR